MLIGIIIGLVIGIFVPAPYDAIGRSALKTAWDWSVTKARSVIVTKDKH